MPSPQYFDGPFKQVAAQACLVDLTPPTFAGIASVVPKNNGAIQVTWLAATDATPPIEYKIYIALGSVSAGTLFNSSNLVTIAPAGSLNKMIFTLADQTTFIIKDQVYTLGVRAEDAVGNVDTNTAILTATALGSVDLATIFGIDVDDLEAQIVLLTALVNSLTGSPADFVGVIEDSEELTGVNDSSEDIVGVVDPEDDLLG